MLTSAFIADLGDLCHLLIRQIQVQGKTVAKYIADRKRTLPMHADLSLECVDRICDIILK